MSVIEVDTTRLPALLAALRLPTVAQLWPRFAEQADAESWPAARFLATLAEHEVAERHQRRIQRHGQAAKLPPGKSLTNFEFAAVPGLSKPQILALADGGAWLDSGANLLLFGPPGVGKTHLAAALGHALIERGYRVLFTRTTDLVQHLQAAQQTLTLPNALAKLDKFDLLILDDLTYAHKNQGETSVLFELIAERYERRSLLISANQPFGQWDTLFPDKAMTVAAIDRLVHHATLLEMNAQSYRRRAALQRQAAHATTPNDANTSINADRQPPTDGKNADCRQNDN